MVAHVKRADQLVPGDYMNLNGSAVKVTAIYPTMFSPDDSRVSIAYRIDDVVINQINYEADRQVEYVTAEEWEAE
jgi:hypothetical protein